MSSEKENNNWKTNSTNSSNWYLSFIYHSATIFRGLSGGLKRKAKNPQPMPWTWSGFWKSGVTQIKWFSSWTMIGGDWVFCKLTGKYFDFNFWNEIWNHDDQMYLKRKSKDGHYTTFVDSRYDSNGSYEEENNYVSVLKMTYPEKESPFDSLSSEQINNTKHYNEMYPDHLPKDFIDRGDAKGFKPLYSMAENMDIEFSYMTASENYLYSVEEHNMWVKFFGIFTAIFVNKDFSKMLMSQMKSIFNSSWFDETENQSDLNHLTSMSSVGENETMLNENSPLSIIDIISDLLIFRNSMVVILTGIIFFSWWYFKSKFEKSEHFYVYIYLFMGMAQIAFSLAYSSLALIEPIFSMSLNVSEFGGENLSFFSAISNNFFNDGMSSLFLWLTLVVISMTMVGSKSVHSNSESFMGNLLALGFLLCWAFSTSNLLVFFFMFEMILMPTYSLMGQWGSSNERKYASYLFFLFSSAGSMLFFMTLMFIGKLAGSWDYSMVQHALLDSSYEISWWLCLSLMVSFAFKMPFVPLHAWLTSAHVEAPTAGSMILAGLLLKLGSYGFMSFVHGLFPEVMAYNSEILYAIVAIGTIYSLFAAYSQTDLKSLLAFSSMMHMNFSIWALCSGTAEGLAAVVHTSMHHGVVATALFFMIGSLYESRGVSNMQYYSGMASVYPETTKYLWFFMFANAGLPFLSGFPGELASVMAILADNHLPGLLTLMPLFGNTAFIFVITSSMTLGAPLSYMDPKTGQYIEYPPDLTSSEDLVLKYLSIWVMLLGVFPELVFTLLR